MCVCVGFYDLCLSLSPSHKHHRIYSLHVIKDFPVHLFIFLTTACVMHLWERIIDKEKKIPTYSMYWLILHCTVLYYIAWQCGIYARAAVPNICQCKLSVLHWLLKNSMIALTKCWIGQSLFHNSLQNWRLKSPFPYSIFHILIILPFRNDKETFHTYVSCGKGHLAFVATLNR